jgi:glycosyltransferase involved in cell wall biosynthesis
MGRDAPGDSVTRALRVSVVVPTFHRMGLLMRCLHALLGQRLAPEAFEVLVVDDGREDAVRVAVEGLASRRRRHGQPAPRLHYLRNPDGQGPAAARNCGWRTARAPIVAFTDDDTIPDAGWLAAGLAAMDAHPAWAAVAGRVDVPLEGDRP